MYVGLSITGTILWVLGTNPILHSITFLMLPAVIYYTAFGTVCIL